MQLYCWFLAIAVGSGRKLGVVSERGGVRIGMAIRPRFPMGNSSIRGCNWEIFNPRGDLNIPNVIPDG
jgi:hypothetical protein